MDKIILPFVISWLVGLILVPLVRRIALKLGLVDRPGGRKIHTKPIPRIGGLAIYRYDAIKGLEYTEPALRNDDDRVEVKCEHFSLYKQMINRGFDRFFINPAMELKYQKLSFSIIKNSLLRYFGR